MADLSRHAGRGDLDRPGAAGDLGVHEGEVEPVAEGGVGRHGINLFWDRGALAGERRLVDLERRRANDPPVGRHQVASFDHDDVAGHDLVHVHDVDFAASADAGLDHHHLLQRRDAGLGLALLAHAEIGVQQCEEDQQHPGWHLVRDEKAEDARAEQHDLHRVCVLAQEDLPARLLRGVGELVEPERGLTGLDLGRRQADGLVDVLGVERVLDGQRMPGRRPGRCRRGNRRRRHVQSSTRRLEITVGREGAAFIIRMG